MVQRLAVFERGGATAKISDIHVNTWFGDYNKLEMTGILFAEIFGEDLESVRGQVVYSGDSQNDEDMFGWFPNSVGVANVRQFASRLKSEPAWVTQHESGLGFAELADAILAVW